MGLQRRLRGATAVWKPLGPAGVHPNRRLREERNQWTWPCKIEPGPARTVQRIVDGSVAWSLGVVEGEVAPVVVWGADAQGTWDKQGREAGRHRGNGLGRILCSAHTPQGTYHEIPKHLRHSRQALGIPLSTLARKFGDVFRRPSWPNQGQRGLAASPGAG